MTQRPKRPCRNKLCRRITSNKNGFCEECQPSFKAKEKAVRGQYEKRRDPQTKKWLNSVRYIKMRKRFLRMNPLCHRCSTDIRPVIATILDHIEPHRGNYKLFWDHGNHQSLCEHCHNVKTATEDGGFGNPRKGKGVKNHQES